ncbi:MAG: hypothetical protein WA071_24035 [Undibacterium umbellatum]|uniref:hypothetical protein n=1 Tax=Undibacterium umbellatum TaxID=2762300 RepID=UPI003BB77D82
MKQIDILKGIVGRAAKAQLLEPTFKGLLALSENSNFFEEVMFELCEEFPFLRSHKESFDDFEVQTFDGLFAWLTEQLKDFPKDSDNPEICLIKILALSKLLDDNGLLWDELYTAVNCVPEQLIVSLGDVIREKKADGHAIFSRIHYNTDYVHQILADVSAKNWKSVEWSVNNLWEETWTSEKRQAYAALYRFDRSNLESLLEEQSDFLEILTYVLHAPVAQSLNLAVASTNWTFKFWALHNSAALAARQGDCFPIEWGVLLSQAARVSDEWKRWLAVLNEYPSRYPQLQEALGNMLVGASGEAIDDYLLSISSISDLGREEIAKALTVFRDKASSSSRRRLWSTAFDLWKKWNFGCNEQSERLLRVAKSVYDFPVVGYLTECMDGSARTEWVAELKKRAIAIERNWYSDITPAMTERFKLISAFQLIAHAEAVAAGNSEWLCGPHIYKPEWEDDSQYRSLKYDSIFFGPGTFSNI